MILVSGRAVEPARDVLPGEDGDHAGHGHRLLAPDAADAGVGVGRAQHLEMQHAVHRDVQRVAGAAGDDRLGERIVEARPARRPGDVCLGLGHAVDGVVDGAVSRAPAEIALEHAGQFLARLPGEAGRGHDHARGAEAALEGLRLDKRLLHGVEAALFGRQPFDRGDLPVGNPKRGHQAAVHRGPVEPHRAGPAIALVAPLLDAEPAQPAQERAQTLAGPGLRGKTLAVHGEVHRPISWRICSPK